ncbi:cell division protein, Fic-like, putative [Bodo saltans]|uniref:Cell division protein, Fic-like, putative n=1 Tax=Bodo saltans TaxID=75058 RepID=A0A0S4KL28_BODSA|nr:cell division protein, Fic-like, putative [Bodo saltans]|eukprot:CUI14218.1 cell division protein, Fic-like, putative [Bodo saltans]
MLETKVTMATEPFPAHRLVNRFQNQPLINVRTGKPATPVTHVGWEKDDAEYQNKKWEDLITLMPTAIDEANDENADTIQRFLKRAMAVFIFDANRLEGTISSLHREGTTVRAILGFLNGTISAPEAVPWNSEGGREPNSPSSKRQLFQAAAAALYLLRDNASSPLTVGLLRETHRIMMEGSFVDDEDNMLAAGVLRSQPEEEVCAGLWQFIAPDEVLNAVTNLVKRYEQLREENHCPVALATHLFYYLITIHPFMNGNGRLCRMMLAWSLMRDGFPFPVSLSSGRAAARDHYMQAINCARGMPRDDVSPFSELNVMTLVSMERVISNFLGNIAIAAGRPYGESSLTS